MYRDILVPKPTSSLLLQYIWTNSWVRGYVQLEAWRIHLTVAATLVDQYWCGSEQDTTLPITAKHSHASLTLLSAAN